MNLVFTDELHRYTLDGVDIPSVSRILDWAGIEKVPYPEGDYKLRGKAVHEAALLYDRGRLGRVGAGVEGYLESYRRFCRDFRDVSWDVFEEPMFHPQLIYAGTPDRAQRFPKHLKRIGDLKTGTPPKKRLGLQTAAYALMAFNGEHRSVERMGIELDAAGGPYKLHICDDPADFDVWIGLVHRWHWEARK